MGQSAWAGAATRDSSLAIEKAASRAEPYGAISECVSPEEVVTETRPVLEDRGMDGLSGSKKKAGGPRLIEDPRPILI